VLAPPKASAAQLTRTARKKRGHSRAPSLANFPGAIRSVLPDQTDYVRSEQIMGGLSAPVRAMSGLPPEQALARGSAAVDDRLTQAVIPHRNVCAVDWAGHLDEERVLGLSDRPRRVVLDGHDEGSARVTEYQSGHAALVCRPGKGAGAQGTATLPIPQSGFFAIKIS